MTPRPTLRPPAVGIGPMGYGVVRSTLVELSPGSEHDGTAAPGVRRLRRPPCASATARTMARPRPVPPRASTARGRAGRTAPNATGRKPSGTRSRVADLEAEGSVLAGGPHGDGPAASAGSRCRRGCRAPDGSERRRARRAAPRPPRPRSRRARRPERRTATPPTRLDPTRVRADGQAPAVGPGEDEEVLGEPRQPVGLLGALASAAPARPRPDRRSARSISALRFDSGVRLVARVVDEPALALDRLLEALEHLVQGLAEPRELVPGVGDGEASPRLGRRDGRRLGPHRLHRSEGGADDEPDHADGRGERHRPADRHRRREPRERLVPIVERRADEQDPSIAAVTTRSAPGSSRPRSCGRRRRRTSAPTRP